MIKRKLIIPDTIEKKHILVAHKLVTSNAEGEIIDTCDDTYDNSPSDTISMRMHGVFIGFIPKTWLVLIYDDIIIDGDPVLTKEDNS